MRVTRRAPLQENMNESLLLNDPTTTDRNDSVFSFLLNNYRRLTIHFFFRNCSTFFFSYNKHSTVSLVNELFSLSLSLSLCWRQKRLEISFRSNFTLESLRDDRARLTTRQQLEAFAYTYCSSSSTTRCVYIDLDSTHFCLYPGVPRRHIRRIPPVYKILSPPSLSSTLVRSIAWVS